LSIFFCRGAQGISFKKI